MTNSSINEYDIRSILNRVFNDTDDVLEIDVEVSE